LSSSRLTIVTEFHQRKFFIVAKQENKNFPHTIFLTTQKEIQVMRSLLKRNFSIQSAERVKFKEKEWIYSFIIQLLAFFILLTLRKKK
jgi:hypothetical protein